MFDENGAIGVSVWGNRTSIQPGTFLNFGFLLGDFWASGPWFAWTLAGQANKRNWSLNAIFKSVYGCHFKLWPIFICIYLLKHSLAYIKLMKLFHLGRTNNNIYEYLSVDLQLWKKRDLLKRALPSYAYFSYYKNFGIICPVSKKLLTKSKAKSSLWDLNQYLCLTTESWWIMFK